MSLEVLHAEIMLARPHLVPRERKEQEVLKGYSYWLSLASGSELRVIRILKQAGDNYELVRAASERSTRVKVRQRFCGSLTELLSIVDEEVALIRKEERQV